jgi:PTH1 family peptidyl-tRNA hydrolase
MARFDWLVVGLGNPGKEYARSRHNVGSETVELLAERHHATLKAGRNQARSATARIGEATVVLAVPATYMNDSGSAVRALRDYYGFADTQIVIVHDELDLEPGVVRLKAGGGLAGHNGLRSITQHLKTQDYLRVRIGVGKPPNKHRGATHVLTRVPARQRELLDVAIQVAADAVEAIAVRGLDSAMQVFHAP